MPVNVAAIVGARPNFMKIAPLIDEIRRRPRFRVRLIHTGQHYSPEMSASLFVDLGLPEPDVNLEAGGGTATAQTATVMQRLEAEFLERRPDLVLVVGDVNSTVAAALVAARMNLPVAHVEAGLRSFDRRMPEEINRVVTDALSDYLFVSEPSGLRHLRLEGVPESKIFFVGNVMIDTLLKYRSRAAASDILARLGVAGVAYAVATLHRPSNVDDSGRLAAFVRILKEISVRLPVVFPVHPRTRQRIAAGNSGDSRLILTSPLGYLDFLALTSSARLILTDSGGIQEEATVLQVPCLTLRENTERPITIEQGTNRLVGADPDAALRAALEVLDTSRPTRARTPELWDGRAAGRILDVLENAFPA
jgi:UDP-N-acetylglucosamine 2-epimerase (non-hydrolysing)